MSPGADSESTPSVPAALPVISVDTGGTFTDVLLLDGGRLTALKVPSTPADPAEAVLAGVRRLAGGRPFLLLHGSTVATNALLERKGARVALVTNRGFEDVIEIGRQNRPQLYALVGHRPPPLVERDDRHGIAGWSSGAIAAFTVAWERPDQFRKVLSGIGTFVNLAGGHVYPEKVRASDRKPLRIFMIDGRNDNRGLNAEGEYDITRDWFYQNVRLKDALVEKGYDVNYSWGIGVHSHDMGGAMLPEMMRWLWRDQPVSVNPHDTSERSFRDVAK